MSAKPTGRVSFSQQVDTKSIPRRENPKPATDPKIAKTLKGKLPRSPVMDFKRVVFTSDLSAIPEGDEETIPEPFIVSGAVIIKEDNLPNESGKNLSSLPHDAAVASQKTDAVFKNKDQ